MVEVLDVGLESVNFAFVEAHEGHETAFDRWYESDHFYAGGVLGPGVLAGRRWYAPKRLRDARYVGSPCPFPDPGAGTNLATYFFNTPRGGDDFKEWVAPQLAELRARGRMFAERTPVNIAFYTFDRTVDLPGSLDLLPHVALDRGFAGLVATFATSGAGGSADAAADAPAGTFTLACTWRQHPPVVAQPDLSPFAPVTLLLTFLSDEPKDDPAFTAAIAGRAAAAADATPMWAGGFLPVEPGDSDYLADLR